MTHTLVTFLGRGREDEQVGYRRATYQFPDGQSQETAFFGLALARHLEVNSVVILGTNGSMWGVLVEDLARADEDEDARLELLEAETRKTVTQTMLDRVASIMSQTVGCQVSPYLISSGANPAEQYAILSAIADAVPNGKVSFDLTHGFRHLGMIGFLSAFMLERVRNLNVRGLWYGALDMGESGRTPVLQLDGLSHVRHWVDALDRFDATGDYGVFAPLLIQDGVPEDKAGCLQRAAFHERTLNLSAAVQQIRTFLPTLNAPLSGASGLFQKRLAERLAWASQTRLAEHQRKLAFEYLKRRDFVRAAVFGWEAFVTLECERQGLDFKDYPGGRQPAIEQFKKEIKLQPDWKRLAFGLLRTIRNTLAHGNPPYWQEPRARAILKSPDRLYKELEGAFQRLLNEGHTT